MTAVRRLRPGTRHGLSLVELLVAIAIIAVLIGLTLGGVQKVRAAAAKAECQNRAKQIGLALHSYHDARGELPPGHSYLGGKDPLPHLSWMTRLLPYVEQQALWDETLRAFATNPSFQSPPHQPILGRPQPVFVCSADGRAAEAKDFRSFRAAFSSYLGVSGTSSGRRDGLLYTDSKTKFAFVTDGLSSTLAVGERPPSLGGEFGWWYAGWGQAKDGSTDSVLGVREVKTIVSYPACPPGPYSFTSVGIGTACDFLRFWSYHAGGANFVFCDGSVRFLTYSADSILPALATRAGGEVVEIP